MDMTTEITDYIGLLELFSDENIKHAIQKFHSPRIIHQPRGCGYANANGRSRRKSVSLMRLRHSC